MHVGKSLTAALKIAEMSHEELAQELGIRRQTVDWLCRQQHTNTKRVQELADLFGITAIQFLMLGVEQ